eukprot:sb/3473124/
MPVPPVSERDSIIKRAEKRIFQPDNVMEGDEIQIKKSPRMAEVGEYSSAPPPIRSPPALNLEGILGQLCGAGSHGSGTPLLSSGGGVGSPQQLILNSLTSPQRSRYGGKSLHKLHSISVTRVIITLPQVQSFIPCSVEVHPTQPVISAGAVTKWSR